MAVGQTIGTNLVSTIPAVRRERQPGRKEQRWAQAVVEGAAVPSVAPALDRPVLPDPDADPSALRGEVDALREEVAALREEVDDLRRALRAG